MARDVVQEGIEQAIAFLQEAEEDRVKRLDGNQSDEPNFEFSSIKSSQRQQASEKESKERARCENDGASKVRQRFESSQKEQMNQMRSEMWKLQLQRMRESTVADIRKEFEASDPAQRHQQLANMRKGLQEKMKEHFKSDLTPSANVAPESASSAPASPEHLADAPSPEHVAPITEPRTAPVGGMFMSMVAEARQEADKEVKEIKLRGDDQAQNEEAQPVQPAQAPLPPPAPSSARPPAPTQPCTDTVESVIRIIPNAPAQVSDDGSRTGVNGDDGDDVSEADGSGSRSVQPPDRMWKPPVLLSISDTHSSTSMMQELQSAPLRIMPVIKPTMSICHDDDEDEGDEEQGEEEADGGHVENNVCVVQVASQSLGSEDAVGGAATGSSDVPARSDQPSAQSASAAVSEAEWLKSLEEQQRQWQMQQLGRALGVGIVASTTASAAADSSADSSAGGVVTGAGLAANVDTNISTNGGNMRRLSPEEEAVRKQEADDEWERQLRERESLREGAAGGGAAAPVIGSIERSAKSGGADGDDSDTAPLPEDDSATKLLRLEQKFERRRLEREVQGAATVSASQQRSRQESYEAVLSNANTAMEVVRKQAKDELRQRNWKAELKAVMDSGEGNHGNGSGGGGGEQGGAGASQ
jgi:hypothetical protein